MKQINRDGFCGYHPAVNFVWFVVAFCFTITLRHPAYLVVSLSGACVYMFARGGMRTLRGLAFYFPVLLLTAAANPIFSHEGATILCYLPSGNPLTLESVFYGAAAGCMLAASLMLFSIMTAVFTADKLVFLLGRVSPALSMIFSMTLGFVPGFRKRVANILRARLAMRGGESPVSFSGKIAEAGRIVSAMASWCLEGTAETADSMRCRGYGLKGRTAFRLWRFERRDAVVMLLILALSAYVLAGQLTGSAAFAYYPSMRGAPVTVYSVSVLLAYGVLYALPSLIIIWEEVRWRSLTSGI